MDMRSASAHLAATLVLAVIGNSPARADEHRPSYRLVVIDPLGGADSQMSGINDDRIAVGSARDASGKHQPIRWHDGQVTVLTPLAGRDGGEAFAINAEGFVCGGSYDGHTSSEPTVWLGRHPLDLGAAPGDFPINRCFGISDHGTAAGAAFDATGSFARLVGFSSRGVRDISLDDSAEAFNTMFNMNRRGVVSAFASIQNPGTLIFQAVGYTVDVTRGQTTVFAPLAGDSQTVINVVTDHGKHYGFSFNDSTQSVVAFDPRGDGTGAILRTEPLGFGFVVANDRLVVETYAGTQNPIIHVNGSWIDLPGLIENLGDFVLGDAADMNTWGDIVGSGFLATGEGRGFILIRQDASDRF